MDTILKWCQCLGFPQAWQDEIAGVVFDAEKEPETPMENLLYVLYGCEATAKRYAEIGIDESILLDSLGDILIWTKNYYLKNGYLGFDQRAWIERFFALNIFRIGRLEFAFGKARRSCERLELSEGDAIIEIHIPQNGPLDYKDCRASIRDAVAFLGKYFPTYSYKYFTCGTWLLGPELKQFLAPDANILKFQSMFDLFAFPETTEALERIFVLNDKQGRESTLQRKVRIFTENGGVLHSGYGVVREEVMQA